MLSSYVGIMGSGKSVLAVDKIYQNFSTDKEANKDKNTTYKNCYTNINEFHFDKLENVYELDFDVLLKILTRLHKLYKAKNNDKYLVRFCELVKIKDTLFVIDEAQNFFDVENKILVWWLTYHRHLFHEILLITPDLGLINLKYKRLNELVYVAKPRSLVLDKRYFVYNLYCSYKLTKATHTGKIKLKSNPKVFQLYGSGDSINSKNIILKFLLIAIAIISFLFVVISYFVSTTKPKEKSETHEYKKTVTLQHKQIVTDSVQIQILEDEEELNDKDFSENTYFKLECSKNKCINEDLTIPPQLLRIFIDNNSVLLLYTEKINQNLSIYYLDTTKQFYKYLIPKKESENEEINQENSTNPLSLGFGSSE